MVRIGYGKIGRSIPLSLEKCGNLGGDVEMAAVVKTLALRHPTDEFILIGRNSGENPKDVGLPPNVTNPWIEWGPELRRRMKAIGLNRGNHSIDEQIKLRELFRELTEDTIVGLDGLVMWVGQHGTTNTPIPSVRNPSELTKPHDWSAYYCSFLLQGINAWRDVDPWNREEIYLNADARNYLKMRDLKWPLRHPVLTQFNYSNNIKHERYGDGSDFEEWSGHDLASLADPADRDKVWRSRVQNAYARLEINGLAPGTPFGELVSFNAEWAERFHFGMFINEARAVGIKPELTRFTAIRDWVLPLKPAWIHGTWSAASQEKLGIRITPAPWDQYYPRLHSTHSTFTTPSSGSGWATTKPWEAFAAGTVCFFHPAYDTQDNILSDAPEGLREWLRVQTPEDLHKRVEHLSSTSGKRDWEWLITAQRAHFDRAMSDLTYVKMIEDRLYGVGVTA